MATTIVPASLTVTVSEIITLGSTAINSESQIVIEGIKQVDKRIATIPNSAEATVVSFGSLVAAGTFIAANVKYIRITNKDATNFIRIRVTKATAETFDVKLEAGKTFMMGNTKESVSATAGAFSAFVDITAISAQADTAAVDIEIFVATV